MLANQFVGNKTLISQAEAIYLPATDTGPSGDLEGKSNAYWAAIHFYADAEMHCPARRTVRAVAAAGAPAYLFQFAYEPVFSVGQGLGAAHSFDIPFYFHVLNWTARHPQENKYILENDMEHELSSE